MRTLVDERLRHEVRVFALRFTCDACGAFDEAREACAFGYPTAEHREPDLERATEIVFCKAFELA